MIKKEFSSNNFSNNLKKLGFEELNLYFLGNSLNGFNMKENIPIHERIETTLNDIDKYIPIKNVESIYTPAGNNSKYIYDFYKTPIDDVKKLCKEEISNVYLTLNDKKFYQSSYFNTTSNKGSIKDLINFNKDSEKEVNLIVLSCMTGGILDGLTRETSILKVPYKITQAYKKDLNYISVLFNDIKNTNNNNTYVYVNGMILPYSIFIHNTGLLRVMEEYSQTNFIKNTCINPIKKGLKTIDIHPHGKQYEKYADHILSHITDNIEHDVFKDKFVNILNEITDEDTKLMMMEQFIIEYVNPRQTEGVEKEIIKDALHTAHKLQRRNAYYNKQKKLSSEFKNKCFKLF